MQFERYLDELGSASPTPGGGSAAAIVAATAAALVAMVARITLDNPRYAERRTLGAGIVADADALRGKALAARERDERAYAGVIAAMALPRGDDAEKAARTAALQAAMVSAAAEPLRIAEIASEIATLAERALVLDNRNLASDLGCAAELAFGAGASAAWNVRTNHRFMRDEAIVARQAATLAGVEAALAAALTQVRDGVTRALAR